jgi:hypothetical protein
MKARAVIADARKTDRARIGRLRTPRHLQVQPETVEQQPEHKTGTRPLEIRLIPAAVRITAAAREKTGVEVTQSTTPRAGRAVIANTEKTAGVTKAAEHLSWSRRLRQNHHRRPETVLLSQRSRR